ncbi:hypothetical protein BJY01DRAFT_228203 [Aspergillus pseudoustus]|uniref:Cell pattern formation-associated protein stuA n=1 Tax=Aspergillus pseudoustus TaxID=1810923 RepID=A0ABR4IM82_9EURO
MAPKRNDSDISSSLVVDSWIQSSQSELDPNFGFIESLYHTCATTLQQLWKARSCLSLADAQQASLKNDVAQLTLWEENFPSCRLDTILGHSNYLRIEVLENLYGIGKILMQFYRRSSAKSEHVFFIEGTKDLSTLIEKAAVIVSENDTSDSSTDSDTDSDCSSMSEAGKNLQGRLHCYIGCLMELGPAIERQIGNIQFKLEQQAIPELNHFSLSENAQPFAVRIKDRFKDAKVPLVERLAEANWERSVRLMTHAEEGNTEGQISSARSVPATALTLFKPFSIFHDSGLGASVPARSQYANTVASHSSFISMAGEDDEGRPRVPALPLEGQNSQVFECPYCGARIRCRNRIDWKVHVFADLQAYVCTHDTCKDAMRTFATRKLWADHEFRNHLSDKKWACFACSMMQDSPGGLIYHLRSAHDIELNEPRRQLEELSRAQKFTQKPDFEDHTCSLCLKSGWQTMKAYATHVGRHLEEISLACLPKLSDDDAPSDSNASQESIFNTGTTSSPSFFNNMTAQRISATASETDNGDAKTQMERLPRHGSGSPKYRCFICQTGQTYRSRGTLKRHASSEHYHDIEHDCWICPPTSKRQPWQYRRDKFRDHMASRHRQDILNTDYYSKQLPPPSVCDAQGCRMTFNSWEEFWEDFFGHCLLSEADANLAQGHGSGKIQPSRGPAAETKYFLESTNSFPKDSDDDEPIQPSRGRTENYRCLLCDNRPQIPTSGLFKSHINNHFPDILYSCKLCETSLRPGARELRVQLEFIAHLRHVHDIHHPNAEPNPQYYEILAFQDPEKCPFAFCLEQIASRDELLTHSLSHCRIADTVGTQEVGSIGPLHAQYNMPTPIPNTLQPPISSYWSGTARGEPITPLFPEDRLRPLPIPPRESRPILPRPPNDFPGQLPPPPKAAKLTAILWEDEATLCFTVHVDGKAVSRREDNNMINGTKLLNVASMTRGRRDAILKGENDRQTTRLGPMKLKGVWIPFERALDLAQREGIAEILYPLFEPDLGMIFYSQVTPPALGEGGNNEFVVPFPPSDGERDPSSLWNQLMPKLGPEARTTVLQYLEKHRSASSDQK